jgi:hypothetical protein
MPSQSMVQDQVQGLSSLLQREGAPNTMMMYGAKEQIIGIFRSKCQDA